MYHLLIFFVNRFIKLIYNLFITVLIVIIHQHNQLFHVFYKFEHELNLYIFSYYYNYFQVISY